MIIAQPGPGVKSITTPRSSTANPPTANGIRMKKLRCRCRCCRARTRSISG